jgi:hypothetical protein
MNEKWKQMKDLIRNEKKKNSWIKAPNQLNANN